MSMSDHECEWVSERVCERMCLVMCFLTRGRILILPYLVLPFMLRQGIGLLTAWCEGPTGDSGTESRRDGIGWFVGACSNCPSLIYGWKGGSGTQGSPELIWSTNVQIRQLRNQRGIKGRASCHVSAVRNVAR